VPVRKATLARTCSDPFVPCALVIVCVFGSARTATADSFKGIYYDHARNQLVVTMAYQGTNPNHVFTLQWGTCQSSDSGSMRTVDADVLDDQFEDAARRDFEAVARFSLADMPCQRPVLLTLYTAPRRWLTLVIPK
jgi:hypothetical protein